MSQGGRLVLIKVGLESIPMYWMSIAKKPKGIYWIKQGRIVLISCGIRKWKENEYHHLNGQQKIHQKKHVGGALNIYMISTWL